jgi:hypothetical protein
LKKKKVTREAKIEHDLGITGDDAIELLVEYGKTFNLDISRFMAVEYFDGEGDPILPAIIRFLKGKKKKKNKILTVGHLEKGIYAGCLDEETINN